MSTFDPNNPDLQQLMADAVTQGLAPQDQAELDRMLHDHAGARGELEAYELSAAAAALALSDTAAWQPMPMTMRDRLIASATPYVNKPLPDESVVSPPLSFADAQAKAAGTQGNSAAGFAWNGPQALGWYAAIAALIALAFIISRPPTETVVEVERVVQVPVQPETPTNTPLDEQYSQLAAKPGVVAAPWGFNADGGDERFANATGQIIFDPETQTGYMKLSGLPVNDPDQEQYQLWIVDADRPDETTNRVDGGVFDVTAAGEVIVPVNPKIVAEQPVVFALTIERPGGVVVSQGPLQVVAAVQ